MSGQMSGCGEGFRVTQTIVPPHLGLRIRPGRDGRQEKQGIIRENKKGMEAWYRPGKPCPVAVLGTYGIATTSLAMK